MHQHIEFINFTTVALLFSLKFMCECVCVFLENILLSIGRQFNDSVLIVHSIQVEFFRCSCQSQIGFYNGFQLFFFFTAHFQMHLRIATAIRVIHSMQ